MPTCYKQRHINNRPHRLMKTIRIAVETWRSTSKVTLSWDKRTKFISVIYLLTEVARAVRPGPSEKISTWATTFCKLPNQCKWKLKWTWIYLSTIINNQGLSKEVNLLKEREKESDQVLIDIVLETEWLRKWCKFSRTNHWAKLSKKKKKETITGYLDSQLKIAILDNKNWV